MTIHNQIQLFETKKIRTVWDDAAEKWYFSVVDVVGVLTEQPTIDRAKKYWSVLKVRLKKEGFEPTTSCSQLKLLAELSTKDISESKNPKTFNEHAEVAYQGGEIANHARMELEAKTGKPVVSPLNAKDVLQLKDAKSE